MTKRTTTPREIGQIQITVTFRRKNSKKHKKHEKRSAIFLRITNANLNNKVSLNIYYAGKKLTTEQSHWWSGWVALAGQAGWL